MRYLCIVLTSAMICLLVPCQSQAWNKPGHMVTGAIAFRELKASNPQVLARVINLLKQHPFFEETWRPAIEDLNSNDPDKEGLFLFMLAARWPDDVRDDPDLHCEFCHFINFRFRPPQTGQPQAAPAEDNILQAFQRNRDVIRSNSSPSVKAMSLAWIFHLTGDAHQPLHSAALFTNQFQQGDRGGTGFFIRVNNNSSTISLHKLWDGFILGSDRFNSVNNRASELRRTLPRNSLPELSSPPDVIRWVRVESFNAARTVAYRNGNLQGSRNRNNGAVLPSDYINTARPVAERRAVLAGYRLADMLAQMFSQ